MYKYNCFGLRPQGLPDASNLTNECIYVWSNQAQRRASGTFWPASQQVGCALHNQRSSLRNNFGYGEVYRSWVYV